MRLSYVDDKQIIYSQFAFVFPLSLNSRLMNSYKYSTLE